MPELQHLVFALSALLAAHPLVTAALARRRLPADRRLSWRGMVAASDCEVMYRCLAVD